MGIHSNYEDIVLTKTRIGFGYVCTKITNVMAYCENDDQAFNGVKYCKLLISMYIKRSNMSDSGKELDHRNLEDLLEKTRNKYKIRKDYI